MTRAYISGTKAAAEAVRLVEVDVVAAYPITPQTYIVEALSKDISDGRLKAEYVPVESEHSAMSTIVGAAMVGARVFTASSSQGLALMHEVLPYASGLRLPLVMAVANRSLASPVTIFSDHQDSLPQRETGFLQFYVENCQEILDFILIAYKVAEHEDVLLPVMVCFDGFFVSHISETVEIPELELAKKFIPKSTPKYPILDIDHPKSFNVMAFPDFFEEFQRDKFESMAKAAEVFDRASSEFEKLFGRKHDRLETYCTEDAEYVLVGLGSMMGTVKECVNELRVEGQRVGLVKVKSYRPFPVKEISQLFKNGKAIGVLDRDVAYGSGGVLYQDICRSLYNRETKIPMVNFILGLGGRDISKKTIKSCFAKLRECKPGEYSFPGQDVFWPDANLPLLEAWHLGE